MRKVNLYMRVRFHKRVRNVAFCLKLPLEFPLVPYIMWANREGSDETGSPYPVLSP